MSMRRGGPEVCLREHIHGQDNQSLSKILCLFLKETRIYSKSTRSFQLCIDSMAETDREKFVRLANKRVNNAIKAIELVGNLSNRSNYDYSQEDAEKIFLALSKELKACRERFSYAGGKRERKFSLE